MKKICTIVGARPQFIKLAVVSRELEGKFNEVVIHTGQHYDYNMSDIFFEELDIKKPDYNLGVSGGTHAKMTADMLIKIEDVLITEKPDMVLLYGDTNSTLAGALSAVKLNIPICHIEAGARLGTLSNPEEANRIATDHLSSLHLVCTETGMEFLKKEGKSHSSYLVGDPMYDAFLYYSNKADDVKTLVGYNNETIEIPDKFYFMTIHRQENTDEQTKLLEILKAMNSLEHKTIYPVHPRAYKLVDEICLKNNFENIISVKPIGYLSSINLINRCEKIVTDSGGVQREAFFAKKPCVTIFDYVIWPETMKDNNNQMATPNKEDILNKLNKQVNFDLTYQPFGDGHSAKKIVKHIEAYFLKA
ncbi:UDP-N-acetylglucosamine 2-epimerase [Candidatus Epulonipiscium fishelsonii]|uniref:UDP-N-acetylglucosamine 2-epimerase n=1 Tax=Candidatus Epulonipiscium fishelsonii TaxID=77094 RepID=A0ACC8XI59_9FIRM|nr:UDP-N-acetylglucosamine 2-epimerase [Epulopiscium sp. SCG-D08WGA-EpuloA1]